MTALDCRVAKQDWADVAGSRNGVAVPSPDCLAKQPVPDADPWEPAVRKLVEFQALGEDWDGFGAKPPSEALLASAVGLAYLFSQHGVHPPGCVVPTPDGAVTFVWQEPDGTYADVEVVEPFVAEVMIIEPGRPARHWNLPTD